MLQAQQHDPAFSFMESAKLIKASGEPLRALQELENSMTVLGIITKDGVIVDLTDDDDVRKRKAKVSNAIFFDSLIDPFG